MKYIGVDVSKGALHVGVLDGWEREFDNTPSGRQRLCEKIAALDEPCRVVLEPTATYHEGIAHDLVALAQVEVMIANPRTTKNFAKALDQRGKTDGQDKSMLARFAAAMPFKAWTPPTSAARALRRVMRRRRQLVELRTAEKVRLEEAKADASTDTWLIDSINVSIAFLDQQIKGLDVRALSVSASDESLDSWRKQLCTIPGVADITALGVISELAFLPEDMDVRQLTAYAGLDPQPFQSGGSDPRRRISKKGNKRLRTTLYLAAWNATRFSAAVRAWHESLVARGKAPNVAYIATARRLLHAMVGLRKTGTTWDENKFHRVTTLEQAHVA